MLIPKFSIRFLLGLMTAVAVFCLIASFAMQGQAWALALCLALGSLLSVFLSYALYFWLTLPLSLLDAALRGPPQPTSPFATDRPPPQILPPQEPE